MDREKLTIFKSEDGFWQAFRLLNSLYGGLGWETSTARKKHEDVFGNEIAYGEIYFKIQQGGGYLSHDKLSIRSMEKLLNLTVVNNPMMERIGACVSARL